MYNDRKKATDCGRGPNRRQPQAGKIWLRKRPSVSVSGWTRVQTFPKAIPGCANNSYHYIHIYKYYTYGTHICIHNMDYQYAFLIDQSFTLFSMSMKCLNSEYIHWIILYCVYRPALEPESSSAVDNMVECPACRQYPVGCIRIPPTARCPLTGELDNLTCQPCIDSGRAVLWMWSV